MKIGDPINKLIHSSGEDILASYRTGERVMVKDGIITKIITPGNYQEVSWHLHDWNRESRAGELEAEQKELDAFHKEAASKAAKEAANEAAMLEAIDNQDLILKRHLDDEARKIIKKMLDQDDKGKNESND